MALKTTAFEDRPAIVAEADPEYEVVANSEGKLALKKIRKVKDTKVQVIPEKKELSAQPIKSKKANKTRK